MSIIPIKRALISVSDKSNLSVLVDFCTKYNIEVISSGGTAKALQELGLTVIPIQDVTGNPEAFGGKTNFQVSSAFIPP